MKLEVNVDNLSKIDDDNSSKVGDLDATAMDIKDSKKVITIQKSKQCKSLGKNQTGKKTVLKKKTVTGVLSYVPKAFVRLPAPNFSGNVVINGEIKQIRLSDYAGKYFVLFFYPLDFTFVCPTEICNFSDAYGRFKEIDCEVMGCSTDSIYAHREWSLKSRKEGGLAPCNLPLLSDVSHDISKDYGVLIDRGADKGAAFRGTFIIDAKGVLRHSQINDLPVGRNVDEVIRLVQAFKYTDQYGEVCPAKWKPGKTAMVTDPSDPKLAKFWEEELTKNFDKEQ